MVVVAEGVAAVAEASVAAEAQVIAGIAAEGSTWRYRRGGRRGEVVLATLIAVQYRTRSWLFWLGRGRD